MLCQRITGRLINWQEKASSNRWDIKLFYQFEYDIHLSSSKTVNISLALGRECLVSTILSKISPLNLSAKNSVICKSIFLFASNALCSLKGEKNERLREKVYEELQRFTAPDRKNGFESATGIKYFHL